MTQESSQEVNLRRSFEMVVQAGLLLAKSSDLKTLIQAATNAGLALSGAQFGAFFYNVIDSQNDASYQLYTVSGVDPAAFAGFSLPRNTALFAPIFEGTGIVRSDDITQDPRYGLSAPCFGQPPGHLPVRSYLAVPVKAQSGEVLGGLFYGHAETGVFQHEHEELVAAIATQAAVAIENFRLREQLTRKIEDLHQAEYAQNESFKHLAELAAIVESSDDAILSKDLEGRIMSWNQAATRVLGYLPGEIIGRSILTIIPEELQQEEASILQKIRSGQRIEHYETVRVTKYGQRLEVSLSISPIRDKSGTIVGASKILRDISARKRVEASLLQAEKIAAAGRMAATIAHEVNNPLEAVMNLLYLAQTNADVREPVRGYLRAAESEVTRVSHIAKQTLGFYRENSSPHAVSLPELGEDVLRIYQPRCDAAEIAIHKRFASTHLVRVRKGEILQVISNLIANSIYAMPDGGELTLSMQDTCLNSAEGVTLTVEDTGSGIPAEHLPRIFEAFFTTRTTIGTGIGLFIARQFIEGHGGKIAVESSTAPEDHGTRMIVFLPADTDASTLS